MTLEIRKKEQQTITDLKLEEETKEEAVTRSSYFSPVFCGFPWHTPTPTLAAEADTGSLEMDNLKKRSFNSVLIVNTSDPLSPKEHLQKCLQ